MRYVLTTHGRAKYPQSGTLLTQKWADLSSLYLNFLARTSILFKPAEIAKQVSGRATLETHRPATAKGHWAMARVWLHRELNREKRA
jgi:hypothetical protein